MEVEEARRGPSAVTIRFVLINTRINIKAIRSKMEIDILGETMGFTLFMAIRYASVTRAVGLIHHTPLASMTHGPPV